MRDAGGLIAFAPEIDEALRHDRPVVALETTLIAHGFPPGEGAGVGRESERRVRAAGAVPATIGVVDGRIRVGLGDAELELFSAAGTRARKLGPRDLAPCVAQRALGATTVGGTLAVMRVAGIRFMGTGGLGGVHRGFPFPPDVSADLAELARTEALVVSAGIKSLLDVGATVEALETLGVPVLGFRTDELPLFYVAGGGPAVSARVESAEEAARVAAAHWGLGRGGLALTRPPDASLGGEEIEALIREALAAAEREGVRGQAMTPFVLAFLHERSGGVTMQVNRELAAANAGLAGEVAAAFAAL